LLIGLLVAPPEARAQTLPFVGKWSSYPENCTKDGGVAQGAPVTITADALTAPPLMNCQFASVLPGGASFRVNATCDAQGQTGHEFFTFAVLGGRLYWSWGERTGIFERCPD
jgi:hypothetical protein